MFEPKATASHLDSTLTGHRCRVVECPLSEEERTSNTRCPAFDPGRTLSHIYSTMFALSTIEGGMLSSSAFAVFELTVNSNSVGS